MKSKVIGTIVSSVTIVVSIILIIISEVLSACYASKVSSIILNIGIGVLGSGIVSLVITFSEYFVEKRRVQERYYNEAFKLIRNLNEITYTTITDEIKLLAAYDIERQSDKWRPEFGMELKTDAFQALYDYYNRCDIDLGEPILNDEKTKAIIDVRLNIIKNNIEKSMHSYINIDSISLEGFENAYGDFFFITDVLRKKNNKKRSKIYSSIHKTIRDMYRLINQENYHFKIYFDAENGNMPVMAEKIDYCNKQLFSIETMNDTHYIVWAKWCDDQFDELEKFRCDMYNDKFTKLKRVPIQASVNGFKKNSL